MATHWGAGNPSMWVATRWGGDAEPACWSVWGGVVATRPWGAGWAARWAEAGGERPWGARDDSGGVGEQGNDVGDPSVDKTRGWVTRDGV